MESNQIFSAVIASSVIIIILILLPWIIMLIRKVFVKNNYNRLGSSSKIRLINSLNESVSEMSKTKTGALITIENKQSLEEFRTDGEKIEANISATLILSIFNKKSPLHDGAIVIKDNEIVYAGTYYKITNKSISNKYGARHRAAMGISEQTDALTIIVSEETGDVTIAQEGEFQNIKTSNFQEEIIKYLDK